MVLLVMCIGYFLVLLDVTIVNVALPAIADGTGAQVGGLQWVVDGYAIALAALMLGGGTAGDQWGHKRMVLSGLSLFGVGSLGCGLAGSVGPLVGCRVLQGVGAALMLPGTLAVIAAAYPDGRAQARAIGIWAAVGSAGLAIGPLAGGLLVESAGWRWVFLLNVPLTAVAVVAVALVVHEDRRPSSAHLDVRGAALAAATLAAVTFAFIHGGRSGLDPATLLVAAGAILAAGAFLQVERTIAAPMLPLGLLCSGRFVTANAVAGTMNLVTLGLLFVVTLYLQDLRHHGALTAGLALLPLALPLGLLGTATGRLTARTGPRRPMVAGLLVGAVGVGLLATVGAHTAYLQLLPALLLWGLGLALLTPSVVAAAVAAAPPDRPGLGSAVNNTSRQAAGAIGVAAFGALAGRPGDAGFLAGLHAAALVAAALFLLAALATATQLRPVR